MIVFTLGTIAYPFNRAVDWLELLLKQETITEPVLFQHGATVAPCFKHPLLTAVTSLSKSEMQETVRQASLVVAHAGQGSTRMLAKMGASFVLIPRLKCYGEHIDDHQLFFARSVERFGVNHCINFTDLVRYIQHPPLPLGKELFDAPSLAKYFQECYQASHHSRRARYPVTFNSELYYD